MDTTKNILEQGKSKVFSSNNIMILDEMMLRQILKKHFKAYVDNFETIDKFQVNKIISTQKNGEKTETKEEYFFVLSFRFKSEA